MQSKNVVFIFPKAYGHLIKTQLIAKYYSAQGYNITFLVNGENPHFFQSSPFKYVTLKSNPSGTANDNKTQDKLVDQFYIRKNEIEKIVSEINPCLIFLDVFCEIDFIILYPILKKTKYIVLSPFLPSFPNNEVPPLNTLNTTFDNAEELWKEYKQKSIEKEKIKSEQANYIDFKKNITDKFQEQNIPQKFEPQFLWENIVSFKNVEKWYLQPYEIDFVKQKLASYERYLGPMIDMHREEEISNRFKMFLKFANANKNNKVIFCSLGSVITQLVKDKNILLNYYRQWAQIALENPTWFIAVKVPENILYDVKSHSINFVVLQNPPYLTLLKRADAFVTHCGGNCYLEAIYSETPMLAVPPSNRFDYKGNAARIVYHQLGLLASISDTKEVLSAQLKELLNSNVFKENIAKMNKIFTEKYSPEYLSKMNIEIEDLTQN